MTIKNCTVNVYNYGHFKGTVELSTFIFAMKIFYPGQFMAFNIKRVKTINNN